MERDKMSEEKAEVEEEERKKIVAPAREEYEKILAAAWEEYKKIKAAAREEKKNE